MKDQLLLVWKHSDFGATTITVFKMTGVWSDEISLIKYFGYYVLCNLKLK